MSELKQIKTGWTIDKVPQERFSCRMGLHDWYFNNPKSAKPSKAICSDCMLKIQIQTSPLHRKTVSKFNEHVDSWYSNEYYKKLFHKLDSQIKKQYDNERQV